jgi:hypothetical protein
MNSKLPCILLALFVAIAILLSPFFPVDVLAEAPSATEVLPSWNEGAAKQAIVDFVKATTDPSSPNFVPPEARIATFDQDGTLWVEHPIYSQVVYCLDRVPALVKAKPELANVEPFKTVLSGDREAPRHKGRHLHPGFVRRGEEGWLDRYQHEERLEAHFRF